MQALGGYVWGELHGVVHLGVKWALAVVTSHYEIDLERVCDDYVLPDEPELAALVYDVNIFPFMQFPTCACS